MSHHQLSNRKIWRQNHRAWMKALQEKNDQAWFFFLNKYNKYFVSIIVKKLNNLSIPESNLEILLNDFISHIFEKSDKFFSFDDEKSMRKYLLTSLHNFIVDVFKRKKDLVDLSVSLDEPPHSKKNPDNNDQLTLYEITKSNEPNPEDFFFYKDELSQMQNEAHWLQKRYREIFDIFKEAFARPSKNAAPLYWVLLFDERINLYQKLKNAEEIGLKISEREFVEILMNWNQEEKKLLLQHFKVPTPVPLQSCWDNYWQNCSNEKKATIEDLLRAIQIAVEQDSTEEKASHFSLTPDLWSQWKKRARKKVLRYAKKKRGLTDDDCKVFFIGWFAIEEKTSEKK